MSTSEVPNKYSKKDLKTSKYAYERYMTAKYYKNLTESQYSSTGTVSHLDSGLRRESLNPAINLNRLKDRIATTDAIAARYTVVQRDWLRLTLERVGGQIWRYKFNYFAKFILLYKAYSEISHYRYLKRHTVMTGEADMKHMFGILQWSGLSGLVLLLI